MNKYKQAVAVSIAIAALAGCGEDFSDFDYSGVYYVTYGDQCQTSISEDNTKVPERWRSKINSKLMKVLDSEYVWELGGIEPSSQDKAESHYYAILFGLISDYFKVADNGVAEIAFSDSNHYIINGNKGKTRSVHLVAKPIDENHIVVTSMVEYKPKLSSQPFDLFTDESKTAWLRHVIGKKGLCLEVRNRESVHSRRQRAQQ